MTIELNRTALFAATILKTRTCYSVLLEECPDPAGITGMDSTKAGGSLILRINFDKTLEPLDLNQSADLVTALYTRAPWSS